MEDVVRTPGGDLLGRADMAWVAERVLVEFDGEVRRDREVSVRDLRRQDVLVAQG